MLFRLLVKATLHGSDIIVKLRLQLQGPLHLLPNLFLLSFDVSLDEVVTVFEVAKRVL